MCPGAGGYAAPALPPAVLYVAMLDSWLPPSPPSQQPPTTNSSNNRKGRSVTSSVLSLLLDQSKTTLKVAEFQLSSSGENAVQAERQTVTAQ